MKILFFLSAMQLIFNYIDCISVSFCVFFFLWGRWGGAKFIRHYFPLPFSVYVKVFFVCRFLAKCSALIKIGQGLVGSASG